MGPDLGGAFDAPLLAALDPDPEGRPGALAFGAALVSALGRWSRDRGIAVAGPRSSARSGAPISPPPAPMPVDADALTSVLRAPAPPAAGRDHRMGFADLAGIAIIIAGLVGAVVIGIALLSGLRSLNPGLLPPASASSSIVPSPSRPPSPSPSPSASPTPTPTRDPFATARARLADMRAAIDGARSGGLKNKDANDLSRLAGEVDQGIEQKDAGKASEAADKLLEEVRNDIEEGRVRGSPAQRLFDAAQALRDAIP